MLGVTEFSGVDVDLAGADGNLQTIRMYFSKPPANLGANYLDELRQSKNITLMLNAAYLSAALDANSATSIRSRFMISALLPLICRARQFVFAMGAIENVRHLLILNQKNSNRFGNIGGDLGRYYMQHLHQELGQFVILKEGAAPAFAERIRAAIMASTEKYLRHNGRGAFRLYSTRLTNCSDLIDHFRNVVTGASCHGAGSAGTVSITCEQVPNADSRILLTGKDDELGQPRIKLDWRISDDDRIAMREAALEFGRYLIHADIGRLNVNPAVLSSATPLQGWTTLGGASGAAGHQMGGARMSSKAADGVVDKDCRVWGVRQSLCRRIGRIPHLRPCNPNTHHHAARAAACRHA